MKFTCHLFCQSSSSNLKYKLALTLQIEPNRSSGRTLALFSLLRCIALVVSLTSPVEAGIHLAFAKIAPVSIELAQQTARVFSPN